MEEQNVVRLHAPSMFNYTIMAHTPADNPEFVNGRVAEVPLEKLTGDYTQKNFMIKFRVNETRGKMPLHPLMATD